MKSRRAGRKEKRMKNMQAFMKDESGIGTIELVLILVVLIGLVLIFKDNIRDLLEDIFDEINDQTNRVY